MSFSSNFVGEIQGTLWLLEWFFALVVDMLERFFVASIVEKLLEGDVDDDDVIVGGDGANATNPDFEGEVRRFWRARDSLKERLMGKFQVGLVLPSLLSRVLVF